MVGNCLWIILLISLFGCSDNPTISNSVEEEYSVYFYDQSGSQLIYRYNPESQKVDSIDIAPYDPMFGVEVLADGKQLLLLDDNSITILETDSFTFVTELPYSYSGHVSISSNNDLIAIYTDSLLILNRNDFSVVRSYQIAGSGGKFSTDSKFLYLRTSSNDANPNKLIRLNLENASELYDEIDLDNYSVLNFRLSPVSDDIYMMMNINPLLQFYSIGLDSITYSLDLRGSFGNLEITSDGSKLFYSTAGNPFFWETPSMSFGVMDLVNKQVMREFPYDMFVDSNNILGFLGYYMAVTPDDKYLVLSDKEYAFQLMTYDIEKDSIIDYKTFPNAYISYLSVQKF